MAKTEEVWTQLATRIPKELHRILNRARIRQDGRRIPGRLWSARDQVRRGFLRPGSLLITKDTEFYADVRSFDDLDLPSPDPIPYVDVIGNVQERVLVQVNMLNHISSVPAELTLICSFLCANVGFAIGNHNTDNSRKSLKQGGR